MKKFSLVMPVYKTEDNLKRAIDSIVDQRDYTEWELIAVADGASEEAKKIVEGYNDPRIKYLEIEHGGAPKARNAGAAIATGDYFSFFSSDFMAYPGMLYEWAKAFDEHPECGFVYGGYDLMENGIMVGSYTSEEFDVDQLKVHNYIDGGFPLRKEIYEPWDETLKSLQDWDFWLGIVDKGHKGYYMSVRVYSAEMPKTGGLSYDSSNNWLERVSTIRVKRNLPNNPICVCSLGAQPHGKRVAKILGNADFMVMPSFKPHKYRMIYLLGFYSTNSEQHARVFAGSGIDNNCVKAIHWIGSDIFMLKAFPFNILRCLRDNIFNSEIDYNLTEYNYTQQEMISYGIKSKVGGNIPIVPMPIENIEVVPELPEKFTIAIYTPQSVNAENTYQLNLMRDIAIALPDVKFVFFGGEKGNAENVEAVGWTDIQEVIKKSSMLLRITAHDGLPVSAIQFLMSNRQVLTNAPMPYSEWLNLSTQDSMLNMSKDTYCDIKDRLINRIRRMQKIHKDNPYNFAEIKKYYQDTCGVEKYKARVNLMLERAELPQDEVCKKYYIEGGLSNG